jgi:hypothetical protein
MYRMRSETDSFRRLRQLLPRSLRVSGGRVQVLVSKNLRQRQQVIYVDDTMIGGSALASLGLLFLPPAHRL